MLSSSNMRKLYEVNRLPIFQNRVYESAIDAKACTRGDVRLVEDLQTGLVYNESFQQHLMVYDKDYQNEQAVSQYFRDHLEEVTLIIENHLGIGPLVEIGCGKGFFLEMLLAKGFNIVGFDPTYEGVNSKIITQNYRPELNFQPNGIILRHVIEHIQDPLIFLSKLKESVHHECKIYLEVPCFDWICKHRAWFDIFYEHVNYFRLSDFNQMFGTVYESGNLFNDQYIFVVAELSSFQFPKFNPHYSINFPGDFLKNVSTKQFNDNKPTAIWGGSSKGVIFALLRERAGHPVSTVIDINPAKQGKYIPATGLLVISPEAAMAKLPKGTTIYVMNSNYLSEIKSISENQYNYISYDRE